MSTLTDSIWTCLFTKWRCCHASSLNALVCFMRTAHQMVEYLRNPPHICVVDDGGQPHTLTFTPTSCGDWSAVRGEKVKLWPSFSSDEFPLWELSPGIRNLFSGNRFLYLRFPQRKQGLNEVLGRSEGFILYFFLFISSAKCSVF